MTGRLFAAALSVLLALGLAGCSGPIGLYHSIEGGAIAQARQAPPGADQPYPNLADVPATPPPFPPAAQAAIAQRVHSTESGVSPPLPGALDGLELPAAPPPLPNVPGLHLPALPSTSPSAPPTTTAAVQPGPNGIPVALAFRPGSAILPREDAIALRHLAATRGGAKLLVGGFGDDASLVLAISRAQRLAAALTANGVPPAAINLVAVKAGSGGFVQLVY